MGLNFTITVDDKGSVAIDGVKQKVKHLDDAATKVSGTLKNLFGAYLGIQGVQKVAGFLWDAAKAANEAEKENRKLSAAMREQNIYTDASFASYKKYADILRSKTAIDDEEIKNIQTLLIRYGFYGEAVNKATEAVLNISAATGKDAASSALQFARTVSTNTNGMTRMGISVNGVAGSTERLNSALEGVGSKFGGAAEAAATEFDKIKSEFSELQESLGKLILPSINAWVKDLLIVIDDIRSKISNEKENWKKEKAGISPGFTGSVDFTSDFVETTGVKGGVKSSPILTGKKNEEEAYALETDFKYQMGKADELRKQNQIEINNTLGDQYEIISDILRLEKDTTDEDKKRKELLTGSIQSSLDGALQLSAMFKDNSKEAFALSKALAIAQATNNSYIAFTAALSAVPFGPWNFVQAGLAMSLGLAQVASIAASEFKAAIGSNFSPGGRTLVGERGQEVMNLPRGTEILSNAKSQSAGRNTGISITINGNIIGEDNYVRDRLLPAIERQLRRR